MDAKEMMGLLKLGAQNTQFGKAATMAARGLGAMTGCTGSSASPVSGSEIIAPKGEQMCLVSGSATIPVKLMEDLTSDRMGVYVQFPDGNSSPVDSEYLVPWNQCFGAR